MPTATFPEIFNGLLFRVGGGWKPQFFYFFFSLRCSSRPRGVEVNYECSVCLHEDGID